MAQINIFRIFFISLGFCVLLHNNQLLRCLMEFTNLHNDIECNCIEGCVNDTQTLYALKTPAKELTQEDFMSYWELGRRPKNNNSCHSKCALKAQSMSILNEENTEQLKNIYIEIFKITPAYTTCFTTIRFNDNCGMTKASPSQRNPHHYDFYKCDEFSLDNVEVVSSINFHEENV